MTSDRHALTPRSDSGQNSIQANGAVDDPGSKQQPQTSIMARAIPIERAILPLRGAQVMLDADLAELYGVKTKVLVQAVKRNRDRFPEDFMFQLSEEEFHDVQSECEASNSWGGRRHPPYAFTEQGVAMLSGVLRSERAVRVNIEIMRAFVRLRGLVASHEELATRLTEMEKKYDARFKSVFEAIRELMKPEVPAQRRIGFGT